MSSSRKRSREAVSALSKELRSQPCGRVAVSDLMQALRADPTLQYALDEDAWVHIDKAYDRYQQGMVDRRTLVDALVRADSTRTRGLLA